MGWTKTRYCYCGNCRFHSVVEKGWESCPRESDPERGKGSWLWVRASVSSTDHEGEDRAYLKAQLRTQVIEDVGSDH